jgi:ABC-2 type transport system ATP-binding protein
MLVLFEGGAFMAGAVLFDTTPLVHFLLLALSIGSILLPLWILSAPFRTHHRLTAEGLELALGSRRLTIPREAIVSIEPVQQALEMMDPLRLRFDAERLRILAAFSESGQLLLRIDPDRIGLPIWAADASSVLLSVDDREALLAALRSDVGSPPREVRPFAVEVPLRSSAPTDTGAPTIETIALQRRFDSLMAVDRLDLRVGRGEIYGFLGLNGAGKTTTIRMLVGLLDPSAGTVRIGDYDVGREPLEARRIFGYVPDRALLYDRLTGREFLQFLAQMRGLPKGNSDERIAHLFDLLDLGARGDTLCGTWSFGMKRKLSLAGALLHEPRVLILDEPFNGLDPRSSRRLKDLCIELASRGMTLFISTHDLGTAESVCMRIGILHGGKLIAEDTPAALRERGGGGDLEQIFLDLTEEPLEPAI